PSSYPLSLHDALPILIAGGDLLQHARRRVARPQEIEAEVTEPRIGAGLGDDRPHAGRHVDAAGADGHLAGRDGDAEHAGALAAADRKSTRLNSSHLVS